MKIGLINSSLNRAFNVSSNWSLFHREISICKEYLIEMDIHIEFFRIVSINFSLANLIQRQKNKMADESNRCITLPYVGNASLVFKKALITQFQRINYHCNIRTFNVSNYYYVVYHPKGSCDETQSYIGETKRRLAVRVQENLSGKSAMHEYISSCTDCHSYSINNFYVLA